MLTIVGQGLVGTLAALEAERRGLDYRVVDLDSGATATRAAAGLFNPLTGPRFTPETHGWDQLVPSYRDLEQRLGVPLVHLLPLLRPLAASKVGPEDFPRHAPGWSAQLVEPGLDQVSITGGGWIHLDNLLDATRAELARRGRLEHRSYAATEGRNQRVLWCGGVPGLQNEAWARTSVASRWQGVRGDVLTVRLAGPQSPICEIASLFLLPLGDELYRWGATHESDVVDYGFRPAAKEKLLAALETRLGHGDFQVVDHRWGVRPASRNRLPLVVRHPDEPGWTMINGFGGRGVVQAPRTVAAWFESDA